MATAIPYNFVTLPSPPSSPWPPLWSARVSRVEVIVERVVVVVVVMMGGSTVAWRAP